MRSISKLALASVAALSLAACNQSVTSEGENGAASVATGPEASVFTVMTGGTVIGQIEIETSADGYEIAYEYRNNGRGPTLNEVVTLNERGLPTAWTIVGNTTFGNPVDESFEYADSQAVWRDGTGEGDAIPEGDAFYLPQASSPYWLAIAARALMADEDRTMAVLPGGEMRLDEMDTLTVGEGDTARDVTAYAMIGTSLNPTYFLMHGENFFGLITPGFSILEEGYEAEDERLRGMSAEFGAARFQDIKSRVAHDYGAPVRIRNARVFDSVSAEASAPVSVVIEGDRIISIDALDTPTQAGEVEIDAAGGMLIPGMFEMHGHMGETSALLNIAAGVTSVRDMGNNNEVLGALIDRIESGQVAGPRIHRSCFIEGQSPFSSNNGQLVSTEEEAVAAVNACADAGHFHQIKIYNSMNPDWVPAMIATARERGLRVAGHVPAFTNANAMIAAGYDEMTHINQVMLGWVLEEGEDTRTLLRLTALQRLPGLDLDSEPVRETLDAMVERGVAIDPTFAIHEALLLSRNGQLAPGVVDYVDNMPVDFQRQARTAWAQIASPEEDEAYRGAFVQITDILRRMREAGIFLVPGTDLGGGMTFHRELELYQTIGMEPAEILAWASHGMADYLGVADELGSIAPGMKADFFLVPGDPTADFRDVKSISMVVADGTVYYPDEVYPEFGIRPFAAAPAVTTPAGD